MRTIDMQTWSRRDHFKLFNSYGYPHFGMCANVDLTKFYPAVKQHGHSLTIAMVYVITRVSNAIPEFRYRIREEKVIEHEIVNSGFTFLTEEDTFRFCLADYYEDFSAFAANASKSIAFAKENPLAKPPQDNVLYMTGFLHPMRLQPEDSIPRFVWGKIFEEGNRLKMPLGVQGHHALIDGIHIGKFYAELQNYLNQPDVVLGEL
jgi:chloramphenicol O-acetyltransferase type A